MFRLPGITGYLWRQRHAWRTELLHRLLTDILPDAPYQFESALSFLQEQGKLSAGDLRPLGGHPGPIRLDLFYHTLPLAIDVLGPDGSIRYHEASPYLSRSAWSEGQRRLALKRARLERYQCPYLILTPDEPTDTPSLKTRVKDWLGHNPA